MKSKQEYNQKKAFEKIHKKITTPHTFEANEREKIECGVEKTSVDSKAHGPIHEDDSIAISFFDLLFSCLRKIWENMNAKSQCEHECECECMIVCGCCCLYFSCVHQKKK